MSNYVPSGKVGGAGVGILLALGLASAVALAFVVHYVGRAFYLMLLFPLVWGLLLGLALSTGVRIGKCRNVSLALIVGVLTAVVSYGVFQRLENAKVRSDFKETAAALGSGNADLDALYDEHVKNEYGSSGFWAELQQRAEWGMSLSRAGRGSTSKKPMLTGMGMYVYWGIELVGIALIALLVPVGAAKEAFCEPCLEWYEKKDVAVVADGKEEEARRALASKDFAAFGGCVAATGSAVLALEKCPTCAASPIRITLQTVSRDKKGKETRSKVLDEMFPREEANALLAALPRSDSPA